MAQVDLPADGVTGSVGPPKHLGMEMPIAVDAQSLQLVPSTSRVLEGKRYGGPQSTPFGMQAYMVALQAGCVLLSTDPICSRQDKFAFRQ